MKLANSNIDEVRELVERMLPREDLFLVDLETRGGQRNPSLWVYIESDNGGVSLQDCTDLNRSLQTVLEAHNVFGGPFSLNVSSPGLDKPLQLPRQYKVNEGRLLRVRWREGEDNTMQEFTGIITAADPETVEITPRSQPGKKGQKPKLQPAKAQRFAYTDIEEAKVLPDM
ncbi:MAG: ribosome maturation factor RimP [Cyclonatronaceae bacterium]